MRSRISAAALLVNVTASTCCAGTPFTRITHAILTDAGWDHLVDAAPGHVRNVRRILFEPLSPEEIETMRAISQRIVERMDPQSRWP